MKQKTVGLKIKNLRKQKGYTLKYLGKKANISISFLSDIENGKSNPSLERLIEIADALETTTSYLMGENCPALENLNKEDKSLSDEFIDMLIRHGKINNKEDLTTQKVLIFLNEIIEELNKD